MVNRRSFIQQVLAGLTAGFTLTPWATRGLTEPPPWVSGDGSLFNPRANIAAQYKAAHPLVPLVQWGPDRIELWGPDFEVRIQDE